MLSLITSSHRNEFGYGRVPASSAPVESDFNDVKSRLFKNKSLPIRIDEAVQCHIDYIMGKSKLSDAADILNKKNKQELPSPNSDSQVDKKIQYHNPVEEQINNATSKVASLCPICVEGSVSEGAHK